MYFASRSARRTSSSRANAPSGPLTSCESAGLRGTAASAYHVGARYHRSRPAPSSCRAAGRPRENLLLPSDAVSLPARELREGLPLRVGGRAAVALRRRARARPLQRVPRRARARRAVRLRRPLCERAPPERVRAHAVAEHHGRRADATHVDGGADRARQQPRALQSAGARCRGVRDARRDLGRAPGGGLPGRDVDGHELRLWRESRDAARPLLRGARPGHAGVDASGGLLVQRQVHAAPLREPVAAPLAAPASPGVDSGRREPRDVGVDGAHELRLLLPLVLRLQARQGDDGRVLEHACRGGRGRQSLPSRLPPARLRRADGRAGRARLLRARALLLSEVPPRLGGLRRGAGLSHAQDAAGRRAAPDRRRRAQGAPVARLGEVSRPGLRDRGEPRVGPRAAYRLHQKAARGAPDGAAADRQHAEGPHDAEHGALRQGGLAASAGSLAGLHRSLVADPRCRQRRSRGVTPAERTVAIRDGAVRFRVLSAGRGPALLHLHSFHDRDAWPPLLDRLAERFTVHAPFHPGVQGSEGVEQLDDVVDLGLAYDELLDALGIGQAILSGHFFGAMVAAEVAALCPARATHVVLISPLGLWLDEKPVADVITLPLPDLDRLLWRDVESEAARRWRTLPQSDAENVTAQIEQIQRLAAMGKFVWPIPDKGLKKRLHRLKARTLLIWGDGDRVNPPAYAAEFRRRIAGAMLRELPGGHMVHLESPEVVAREIGEFCS